MQGFRDRDPQQAQQAMENHLCRQQEALRDPDSGR
jgi:hypothetical protein